ncbi:MAG: hypothetical protein RBG13Loki_1035 [Promethearchaeota archaeon CR_4]|nr:MAG: hypothetical protein RBG13Loki_1035 [Candidatus Lokiarchaeota archaeon CR_4]
MLRTNALVRGWCLVISGIIVIVFMTPFMVINYGPQAFWLIACGLLAFGVAGLIFAIVRVDREREAVKIKRTLNPNLHGELLGMANSQGAIELQYLANAMGMSVKTFRQNVVSLIAIGKLSGTITEDVYRPTGDFPQVINTLILDL